MLDPAGTADFLNADHLALRVDRCRGRGNVGRAEVKEEPGTEADGELRGVAEDDNDLGRVTGGGERDRVAKLRDPVVTGAGRVRGGAGKTGQRQEFPGER